MNDQAQATALAGLDTWDSRDLESWNWFCRDFPGAEHWRCWCAESLSPLFQRPAGIRISLKVNRFGANFVKDIKTDQMEIWFPEKLSDEVLTSTPEAYCAHLFCERNEFYLVSYEEKLPIYHNSAKMMFRERRPLSQGDKFTIFPYEFTFEYEQRWEPDPDVEISSQPVEYMDWEEFISGSAAGIERLALRVQPQGEIVCLEIPSRLCGHLVDHRRAAASDFEVLEFAVLSLIETANGHFKFRGDFELAAGKEVLSRMTGVSGISVRIVFELSGYKGAVRLFAPMAFLRALKAACALPVNEADLNVVKKYLISPGRQVLGVAEFLTLEPGDVLFLEPEAELIEASSLAYGWKVEIDVRTCKLIRPFISSVVETNEEVIMEEQDNLSGPDPDNLPVRVHVILDELDIPYSEIKQKTPGTTIELGRDLTEAVKIALNGKVMGEGKLVNVDNRLGVQVLRWSCQW